MTTILLATTVIAGYVIADNRRFKLKRQPICISNLPIDFENFKIVQISDLHSKGMQGLANAVIEEQADIVLFTGDMFDTKRETYGNTKPVYDLIDAIAPHYFNRMYWVDGNHGLQAIKRTRGYKGAQVGRLTTVGEKLKEKGVTILDQPISVKKGDSEIWLTPDISEKLLNDMTHERIVLAEKEMHCLEDKVAMEQKKLDRAMCMLKQTDSPIICVNHYPLSTLVTDKEWTKEYHIPYDLQISGHYHNGQWTPLGSDSPIICVNHYPLSTLVTDKEWTKEYHIPYDLQISGHYHNGQWTPLGFPIFIPRTADGLKSGLFPSKEEASGLSIVHGIQQYTSAGLGASTPKGRVLQFRFMNTPTLDVLTLKRTLE